MRSTCRGHKPESTRNRLDLPDPLGPITRTDLPGGTEKVSSLTSGVPSGALSATLPRTQGQPLAASQSTHCHPIT